MPDAASFSRHDDYDRGSLDPRDVAADPLEQFSSWLAEAEAAEVVEPNAMVLSTVDRDERPTSRTVLLKGIVDGRFEFVTDSRSRKGRALAATGRVALAFPWWPLQRQVLVDGEASPAAAELSDRYWASRPRGSQLGAWTSEQSAPIASRDELQAREHETAERFGGVDAIPRPPYWGAWLVTPSRIEFWQGRPSRLHDRVEFTAADGGWRIERLQP